MPGWRRSLCRRGRPRRLSCRLGSSRRNGRAQWTRRCAKNIRFRPMCSGRLKVSLNGKSILEGAAHAEGKPVQLNKGENKLLVEYQSPASGDAMFRLNWASKDFPVEPLQPTSVLHDSGAADLRTGERLREGRLLFAQLHCTACHDGSGLVPAKGEAGAMPELAQDVRPFSPNSRRPLPTRRGWRTGSMIPHSIRPRHTDATRSSRPGPRTRSISARRISPPIL